jgi:hypothetical protein
MGPDETLPPEQPEFLFAAYNESLFTLLNNPVQEELTVILADNYHSGKLEIMNLQGKVLRSCTISNLGRINLNLSDFRPGLYLVKLELENHAVMVKKFIKE